MLESAWQIGREIGMPALINKADEALALLVSRPAVTPSKRSETLTQREHEVARLIAEGLSNRQIGSRLFLSERTIDTHVQNILNKLGFSSRTQVAAWAVAAGLVARSKTEPPRT